DHRRDPPPADAVLRQRRHLGSQLTTTLSRVALALLAAASGLATGCHDPITEVVVLLESDLVVPNDANLIEVQAQAGTLAPMTFGGGNFLSSDQHFPMSIGFTSGGSTDVFSFTVALSVTSATTTLVIRRSAIGIRFAQQQIRMF